MDLTGEEYNALTKAGVKVTFDEESDLQTYLGINNELDAIVRQLNLDANSTDQEKLDAILIYILDNLSYDEQVSEALQNNTEHSELTRSFYQGGYLYGALEKSSAICGNYAALFEALAERTGLDSYFLLSPNHAWNLVEINGEKYYVDATWLDSSGLRVDKMGSYTDPFTGELVENVYISTTISAQEAIQTGYGEALDWYLANPESYPYSETQAESHEVINLPSIFQLNPKMAAEKEETVIDMTQTEETTPVEEIEPTQEPVENETQAPAETEPIKISDEDKFEVKIGDKKWIIGGAAAIGLMSALGGAVAYNKKKKAEERRRRMQQNPFNDDFVYGSSYPNQYNQYSQYNTTDWLYDDLTTPTKPTGKRGRRGRR